MKSVAAAPGACGAISGREEEREDRERTRIITRRRRTFLDLVGRRGRFLKSLSEVQGGPGGRARIARGPSEKPIPGQKWHGTHRRSSFKKRNVFTTVCCLCKSCVLTQGIVHLE